MWPLLRKDGLATQYIALTVLWNRLIGHGPYVPLQQATFFDAITWVVYLGCALVHLLEFAYRPPARYPDLYPVLNVLVSTPVFLFTWLWSIKSIIEARWTAGGLSVVEPKKERRTSLGIGFPSESLGPAGVSTSLALPDSARNRREKGWRPRSLGYGYAD